MKATAIEQVMEHAIYIYPPLKKVEPNIHLWKRWSQSSAQLF